MESGQVQNVLICQTSSNVENNTGFCPAGQSLSVIQAYVLSPDSKQYIDEVTQPLDYSVLGQYFGLAFASVITLYILAKSIGLVISSLKN